MLHTLVCVNPPGTLSACFAEFSLWSDLRMCLPAPDTKRVWGLCRYTTWVIATCIIVFGCNAKPDTSIITWAKKHAQEELVADGVELPRGTSRGSE